MKITLRPAPHKRAMLERKMRYDILLDGKFFDTLTFNMRGYIGYLPYPAGEKFYLGERPLGEYRREIAKLNREFKNAEVGAI